MCERMKHLLIVPNDENIFRFEIILEIFVLFFNYLKISNHIQFKFINRTYYQTPLSLIIVFNDLYYTLPTSHQQLQWPKRFQIYYNICMIYLQFVLVCLLGNKIFYIQIRSTIIIILS